MSSSPSLNVAIIGAGYAGLACAAALAQQGIPTTVFERASILGGRARLVRNAAYEIDNGQHLLIGAYTELLRLMRVVGASPKTLETRPLHLLTPGQLEIKAARLPAPLHLALGLLRAKGLLWADKLALLRLMQYLKARHYRLEEDVSVRTLLTQTGQTPKLTEHFWAPLCVAALNTVYEEASAQIFANVLRDSLGAYAHASHFLLPRKDLTELFPVPAARYLATRKGNIHIATPISSIEALPQGGYRLGGDPQALSYSHLVIATAPYHVDKLLSSHPAAETCLTHIRALQYNAITTLYLHFESAPALPAPMIGLADGPVQFIFDRGQFYQQPGLWAAVISAPPEPNLSHDVLIEQVLIQINTQLSLNLPKPDWTQIITEKRATFACTPGLKRPNMETGLPQVYLAGDYVAGDYPATLEGAVRAGLACAKAILPAKGSTPA